MPNSLKPRICRRCGKPITGYFCTCRRRKSGKAHSASSGGGRRGGNGGGVPLSPASTACALPVPLWESDPARFWGEMVQRVRTAVNASGGRLIVADLGRSSRTFPLEDVREHVERFWIFPMEPQRESDPRQ